MRSCTLRPAVRPFKCSWKMKVKFILLNPLFPSFFVKWTCQNCLLSIIVDTGFYFSYFISIGIYLFFSKKIAFRNQVTKWPDNPLHIIINWLQKKQEGLVIADMGCGEAELAVSLQRKHTIYSFDFVAVNEFVHVADISNVPLQVYSFFFYFFIYMFHTDDDSF